MGEDPIAFIRNNHAAIAHIQLADYPGRHEPGTGRIDFGALFAVIREVGYRGSIGHEYIPTRPIQDGVPLKSQLGMA